MNIVALFVVIPILTAILVLGLSRRVFLQRSLTLAGSTVLLGLGIWVLHHTLKGNVMVLNVGSWRPQTGITWVIDGFSALMLTLTSLISLLCIWYSSATEGKNNYYYTLHNFLIVGINGCFVTADLFNLFVFFEVMILTSFVQIMTNVEPRNLAKTYPYIVVNLVASMIFLAAIGVLYASTGTVNMALIARSITLTGGSSLFWSAMWLLFLVFSLKTALVPLFFWLPDSYPAASASIAALFAGLLTKIGVYVLYRTLTLFAHDMTDTVQKVLIPICLTTMVVGVLGALGRRGIRAILSFHSISQMGYIILCLALLTQASLAAGIFFIIHHSVVKTALFLSAASVEWLSHRDKVENTSGLAISHPLLALGFFISAISLAGLPPLSGFWVKFFVLKAALESQAWVSFVFVVFVSFFTLASMLKIWNFSFWGTRTLRTALPLRHYISIHILVIFTVVSGLGSVFFYTYIESIGAQLAVPDNYINAVIGENLKKRGGK